MTTIHLPDSVDLRTMPELGALALLDAALVVADQVLEREHANLYSALERPGIERTPEVVIAYLLVRSMTDLRRLLGLYAAAVRRSQPPSDLPF